ncbi:MAG: hypothetical protein A2Y40_07555 [Candidatus Margulisbacteria bacterium GWF2_35_9]|nr:MAG: hypothetical protein A2Y40_07555 [Candidatus Margulisbacteria bacterium GWF2_35_9]
MQEILTLVSWPQAIVHIDGDSFFASVEQSLNHSYKNKPLVTGSERGIASAMSADAKKLGITRGMPIGLIKKNYPECIIVPGNYEAYMLFAHRMFSIMRRFTPIVEEYSIDEAFADITGLRRTLNANYQEIAVKMQSAITSELDITVSVGVSLTKSLAKLCSKFRKPNGITCVKGKHIHILLQKTPIEKVWGIGPNISSMLRKYGCQTAYDFTQKPLPFVEEKLTKKEVEIYKELRGEQIYKIDTNKKESYQSISKAKTFNPTSDKNEVFAQLVKNIEEATAKCRKYNLAAKSIVIALKSQKFQTYGQKAKLNRPSADPMEIVHIANELFETCYRSGKIYRQTICVLINLCSNKNMQLSLFDQNISIEKREQLFLSIDELNKRFGIGTIHLADSLNARHNSLPNFNIPQLEIPV